MNHFENLLEKLDRKLEEINWYFEAYQNEAVIYTNVTDKLYPGEFLKDEQLEDVGYVVHRAVNNVELVQHWSNGKSVHFHINEENELAIQLHQEEPGTETNVKRINKVIELLQELIPIQAEIEELRELEIEEWE